MNASKQTTNICVPKTSHHITSHGQSNCCYTKSGNGGGKSSEDCTEHERKNTKVETVIDVQRTDSMMTE